MEGPLNARMSRPYHRNDSCERLNVPITISSLKYRRGPKYGLPGHDRETHEDMYETRMRDKLANRKSRAAGTTPGERLTCNRVRDGRR